MSVSASVQRMRNPVIAAWLALIASTVVSWYLGDGHGAARVATVGVLLVAFLKVYLVGRYFMELKYAPRVLHAVFAGWNVAMAVTLVSLYIFGA